MKTLREELIQRILSLHPAKLQLADTFLRALECGDASPPSFVAEPPSLECGDASRDASPLLLAAEPLSLSAQRVSPSVVTPHPKSEGSENSESGDASPHSKDWPHAPLHRLTEEGTHIVTCGTLYKQHFFQRKVLLDISRRSCWNWPSSMAGNWKRGPFSRTTIISSRMRCRAVWALVLWSSSCTVSRPQR